MSIVASPPDPYAAAAIARAEVRRGMLERASQLSMELVEIAAQCAKAPEVALDVSIDASRRFNNLMRTLRLTLMFETRLDEKILAIRNGKTSPQPAAPAATKRAPAASAAREDADSPAVAAYVEPELRRDSIFPERNRIRDVVWEAIDREVRDPYDAPWMLDRLHERLIDGDAYDALIGGDFRACIAAICADLGLHPDWDRWSDGVGFVRKPDEHFLPWARVYSYDPVKAAAYVARRAERSLGRGPVVDPPASPEPEPHPRQ